MKILSLIIFGMFKALCVLGYIYLVCNDHPFMAIGLLFAMITLNLEMKE